MDSDFWTMRLASAKRQFNMQNNHNHQLDRYNMEDFEVEEEVRPDYPCPYCCEEFDSLCSHLEAEHPYESKATRRGRLCRVPFPNSQALSLLGRDLREAHLQVLLGGTGFRSSSATSSSTAAAPDNFLASLVLKFPASESDEITKSLMSNLEESSAKTAASQQLSFHSSLSREERKQRTRQAAGRAVFVQDLLVSTLLAD